MSFKILLFPLFSLLTLSLIIGFLKPDLDTIIEKKDTIKNQRTLIEDSGSIAKHIDQLTSVVNENLESKKILFTYLPTTFDQDVVIDSFNFLATNSNLFVDEIIFDKGTNVAVNNLTDGDGSSTIPNKQKVSLVPFTGKVIGSYQDIKTFLSQLTHTNRFQNMNSFSLESKQKSNGTEVSDLLEGTINIDYGYLRGFSVSSAIDVPFLKNKLSFDLSPITIFKDKMTNIPLSVVTMFGKENPFK